MAIQLPQLCTELREVGRGGETDEVVWSSIGRTRGWRGSEGGGTRWGNDRRGDLWDGGHGGCGRGQGGGWRWLWLLDCSGGSGRGGAEVPLPGFRLTDAGHATADAVDLTLATA